MRSSLATSRYAAALYQAAQERGETERVLGDLERLAAALAEQPDLSAMLLDPRVAAERKERTLLEGPLLGACDLVSDLVRMCLERRRAEVLLRVHEETRRLDREARGVVVARVVSAAPLSPAERDRVRARLSERLERAVELVEEVDPSLIGGLRVFVASRMWDGSVRRRLDDLIRRLNGVRVAPAATA